MFNLGMYIFIWEFENTCNLDYKWQPKIRIFKKDVVFLLLKWQEEPNLVRKTKNLWRITNCDGIIYCLAYADFHFIQSFDI